MQHGHTSRNYAKTIFAFAALGLAAACADSTVAPTSQAAFKAPAGFNRTIGVTMFRVSNADGVNQRLGDHFISIPAGAICDPLLSSYGSTEWNNECHRLAGSIVITATSMEDNNGHPYVDFQPALRFAPSKNVMLFLRDRSTTPTALSIMYCNNVGFCVDESKADPSVAPFRVNATSILGRRVKHFSGYSIAAGDACQGTVTQLPDGSLWCEDGGLERRSGYILASGLVVGHGTTADSTSRKKSEQ